MQSPAQEFAIVANAIVWPATLLILMWTFFQPIYALLRRLAETLTFKSVKVKALGVEADLSPEYARSVLNDLLDDITDSSNQLSALELRLFDEILKDGGNRTVGEVIPGFKRDTPEHEALRNLRDQKLIVPAERGQWKDYKHPAVTRYGQLVAKLRNSGDAAKSVYAR